MAQVEVIKASEGTVNRRNIVGSMILPVRLSKKKKSVAFMPPMLMLKETLEKE